MEVFTALSAALDSDDGFLIGRNGQLETHLMIEQGPIHDASLNRLELHAGIFPMPNREVFMSWRTKSIQATQAADLLVTGWYKPLANLEAAALTSWQVEAKQIPLRSLEPYYEKPERQWTSLLRGHDVAVVSSFTKTAAQQVKKGGKIWGSKQVLYDDIRWHWVQTGHAPSVAQGSNEWPAHVSTWQEACDYVVGEVVKTGARVILIGCGGLSMPIAHMLKLRGHIVIVLGGAIQVLFGIKGQRWATHPIISTFWTDEWVWPSQEETPGAAGSIEGGCYWLSKVKVKN